MDARNRTKLFRALIILLALSNIIVLGQSYLKNVRVEKVISAKANDIKESILTSGNMIPLRLFGAEEDRILRLLNYLRAEEPSDTIYNALTEMSEISHCREDVNVTTDWENETPNWEKEIRLLEHLKQILLLSGGMQRTGVALRKESEGFKYRIKMKLFSQPDHRGLLIIDDKLQYRDVGTDGLSLNEVVIQDDTVVLLNGIGEEYKYPIEQERWCYYR